MFAQASLNEIQRSSDTITLSSLPSQAGWGLPFLRKSRSSEAPEERAPLETDYTSVDKQMGLHFTPAWDERGYYLLPCVFPFLYTLLSVM